MSDSCLFGHLIFGISANVCNSCRAKGLRLEGAENKPT